MGAGIPGLGLQLEMWPWESPDSWRLKAHTGWGGTRATWDTGPEQVKAEKPSD